MLESDFFKPEVYINPAIEFLAIFGHDMAILPMKF